MTTPKGHGIDLLDGKTVIVFSDSHGDTLHMERALRRQCAAKKPDMMIFLGDGLFDFNRLECGFPSIASVVVAGNCDRPGDRPSSSYETVVEIFPHRVFVTHGHMYDVKSGYGKIAARAVSLDADIVLFGHTHAAVDTVYETGDGRTVRLINPGSVTVGPDRSFALLHFMPGGEVVCGFGRPA